MKWSLFPSVFAGVLGLTVVCWLAYPITADAQSTHKRHKAPEADSDDPDASPSPSPTPRVRHGKTAQPGATATPTPRVAPTDQPSTANEAAPSKSVQTNDSPTANRPSGPAATASLEPGELENFDAQPEPVRQLLTAALDLTKRNLTYAYGSADPAAGGMDCSGTIYYLLKQEGFGDVPRQANEQYSWVRSKARFYAVLGKKQDTPELNEMRPGDLLFWTGTYHVDRDPPVTHTMIYLGRRKKDGHRLMFGASDGRTYDGQRRNGVSVFDFRLPAAREGDAADAATAAVPDHAPDFAGYGPVPGMADLNDAASRQTVAARSASASAAQDESDGQDAPPKLTAPKRAHATSRPHN